MSVKQGIGFTYWTRHRSHTEVQHMKLLHQLCLWHRKLWRQNEKQEQKKGMIKWLDSMAGEDNYR